MYDHMYHTKEMPFAEEKGVYVSYHVPSHWTKYEGRDNGRKMGVWEPTCVGLSAC